MKTATTRRGLMKAAQIVQTTDLEEHWRHFLEGEGKWWFAPDAERRKAEVRATLDSVQAFRDAKKQHDHDSGMDAANERWEALAQRERDALKSLLDTPAPDLAALRWKLDFLMVDTGEPDGDMPGWSADYFRQALADIARLLPDAREGGAA